MTRRIVAIGASLFGLSALCLAPRLVPSSTVSSQPAAAAAVVEDSPAPPLKSDARDERELRQLSQRVNQLQLDQAALRAQLADARAKAEEAHNADPHDPQQTAAEEAELQARDRARIETITKTFDAALEHEGDDPTWSEAQEVSITQAFADGTQGKLLGARCSSTLCKLEVMHDSTQAAEMFVATSGTLKPFINSKGFYRYEPSAQGVKLAFFVARQGHDLPAL